MKLPNIRISPLGLFLITLFALFLSILLGRYISRFRTGTQEGFIKYQYGVDPLNAKILAKYNDKTALTKIYDNLFYDANNGNIIDVNGADAPASFPNASGDFTGDTISKITVVQRDNTAKDYNYSSISASVPESLGTKIKAVSTPFTRTTTGDSPVPYQYFYIPWGRDTYVHIIQNNAAKKHIGSFFLGSADVNKTNASALTTGANSGTTPTDTNLTSLFTTVTPYTPTGQENKTGLTDSNGHYTGGSLTTVCSGVRFDSANGNLIITNASGAVSSTAVYQRSQVVNGAVTISPTATATASPTSKYDSSKVSGILNVNGLGSIVVYTPDNYCVVYVAYGLKTLVLVLNNTLSTTTTSLNLQNVCRFDAQGSFVLGTEGISDDTKITTGSGSNDTVKSNVSAESKQMDDFLNRFFNYYYSVGSNSNDYLLKTQVVPPVCPTCPSCPSSGGGVCTNCGGNGGSGTKGVEGKNILDKAVNGTVGLAQNTVGGVTDVAKTAVGETTGLIKSTVDDVKDLAKSTGSGAVDLAKSTAGGAADLVKTAAGTTLGVAKDTVGGAVGIAKDTAGGAVGLVRDTASGAVGLVRGAASGLYGLLPGQTQPTYSSSPYALNMQPGAGTGAPGNMYGGQVVPTVVGTAGNDPYSLYGALPNRGSSNYMPITADFSAFGR